MAGGLPPDRRARCGSRLVSPEAARSAHAADFSKFFDHYLPRVLGFSRRRRADEEAAERLTEEILAEVLRSGGPLMPGPATDEAVLGAALRVGQRGL